MSQVFARAQRFERDLLLRGGDEPLPLGRRGPLRLLDGLVRAVLRLIYDLLRALARLTDDDFCFLVGLLQL